MFFVIFTLIILSTSQLVKVAHGELSHAGQFPHMVSIICSTCYTKHYCGGGLINENTVLLAAHCIRDSGKTYNPRDLYVQAGTTDVSQSSFGTIVRGKSADVHPNWKADPVGGKYINDYDIAILHLESNITENGENIRYMDLDFDYFGDIIGDDAVISGWGYYDTSYSRDMKLRNVIIPIQKGALCESRGLDFTKDLQICAGDGRGKDSCAGDSGSPLVRVKNTHHSKRWICIGIVSFGTSSGCGVPTAMGVYTKISALKDWILSHTSLPPPVRQSFEVLPYLSTLNLTFTNGSANPEEPEKKDPEKHVIHGPEEPYYNAVWIWFIPIPVLICVGSLNLVLIPLFCCIPCICLCFFIVCCYCVGCTCCDVYLKYRKGFIPLEEFSEEGGEVQGPEEDVLYETFEDGDLIHGKINTGDDGEGMIINNSDENIGGGDITFKSTSKENEDSDNEMEEIELKDVKINEI